MGVVISLAFLKFAVLLTEPGAAFEASTGVDEKFDDVLFTDESTIALERFALRCYRKKATLGQGNQALSIDSSFMFGEEFHAEDEDQT